MESHGCRIFTNKALATLPVLCYSTVLLTWQPGAKTDVCLHTINRKASNYLIKTGLKLFPLSVKHLEMTSEARKSD